MIRFETELIARSYECDLYGHVNNATYLNYCEAARVEFLHELGFSLQDLKKLGFLLPIVRIEINYKKSVYAGDHLRVSVEWLEIGRSSSRFRQEVIKNGGEVAAEVYVTWIVSDLRGKPISLPKTLLQAVEAKYKELPPKAHHKI